MATTPDDFIPFPLVFMTGVRAWDNSTPQPEDCPVCKGGVRAGDDRTYCGKCDSVSPALALRCVTARIKTEAQAAAQAAEEEIRGVLLRRQQDGVPTELAEADRRRLWNGYRGSLHAETPEPTNRAKIGRQWLTEIGQAPDFDLILDGRGNVIGRYSELAAAAELPAIPA